MRYCCMFEIMTIHMHKLVKISGIVNRQPWNRLNSYAAHSVFWARRKQDGVQITSWRYSVYTGTLALTIAGSQGHINNYWTRHTLFLTDEHTQYFMCNGQINEHSSRRSRIFLRRRPLSCEVPSRRDSVGGGVVAEFFRGFRKPTRFSGGVVAEFFRRLYNSRRDLMGPFYIFWHSRRGTRAPPLNRPLHSDRWTYSIFYV